jgi:hypothetical protein
MVHMVLVVDPVRAMPPKARREQEFLIRGGYRCAEATVNSERL